PPDRTQPKVPLVQGLPTVPTKKLSSLPGSKSARFVVGSWKSCAEAAAPKPAQRNAATMRWIMESKTFERLFLDFQCHVVQPAHVSLCSSAGGAGGKINAPAVNRPGEQWRSQPARFGEFAIDGIMFSLVVNRHGLEHLDAAIVELEAN